MAKQASREDELTEIQMMVLRQFRLIFGSVRQHFREVEKQCGISGSQLWLLRQVATTSGIGVSRLAEHLSIHQSTCSLLVDKLVVGGYLSKTRSATDQRRVGLEVTQAGKRLLRNAPGPAEGVLPEAIRQTPDIALHSLQVSLDELISHLTARNDDDAERPLSDL